MEQKQIASLENKIKKESGNIAGIIVLKDDNVVYENYFNQCSGNDPIQILLQKPWWKSNWFFPELSNQKKGENNTVYYNP